MAAQHRPQDEAERLPARRILDKKSGSYEERGLLDLAGGGACEGLGLKRFRGWRGGAGPYPIRSLAARRDRFLGQEANVLKSPFLAQP